MGNEPKRVLFVHAHPDDETLATGGTIATLVDSGVEVTVLSCTRGERGEVIPAELAHLEGDGPRLAEHRMGELAEAMRILGGDHGHLDHRYLGNPDARQLGREPRHYLDSGMVWGAHGPEPVADPQADSLCSAPLTEVVADIASVIAELQPDTVISYDGQGGYGHPDHLRVHDAAKQAAEMMAVPFFEIVAPDEGAASDGTLLVDVSPVLQRKADAMRAHRTQISVDGDRYSLSSGPSLPIGGDEAYRRVGHLDNEDPGFAGQGLRAKTTTCAIALAVGLGVGLLGTIHHQSTLTLFGAALPLGAIAALLIAAALLVGVRLVFDHRVPSLSASLGIIAVLLVFAQPGPGGSVLIPADPVGYAWTFGTPFIAALVLAWPRLPAGPRG